MAFVRGDSCRTSIASSDRTRDHRRGYRGASRPAAPTAEARVDTVTSREHVACTARYLGEPLPAPAERETRRRVRGARNLQPVRWCVLRDAVDTQRRLFRPRRLGDGRRSTSPVEHLSRGPQTDRRLLAATSLCTTATRRASATPCALHGNNRRPPTNIQAAVNFNRVLGGFPGFAKLLLPSGQRPGARVDVRNIANGATAPRQRAG
jgi:hypothetical protein